MMDVQGNYGQADVSLSHQCSIASSKAELKDAFNRFRAALGMIDGQAGYT